MKYSNDRPIAFVLTSTNHGTMLVNRNDYHLTPGGGYGVGYQLLNKSSFDQSEVDFALQLLSSRRELYGNGVIAIDCGANIGVHTIEWSQFMHSWGNVIAIEAQERIFYALAGNIILNNCSNARAIWAALGSEEGYIKVPQPDYFSPASFGSLEIRKNQDTEFIGQEIDYQENTIRTRMLSIDSMHLDRIDFMKIDIEGMEMEALTGAKESITKFKPQLIIEKIKTNESELTEFLLGNGYCIFPLGINLLAIHSTDPMSNKIS
jgi:FkbM family methyltransferase